jgi:ribosomal protein L24
MMAASRFRSGDQVKVISGDSKGSTGKVIRVDMKKGLVVVEGVNIRSKHVKPMKEGESGSIVKKEMAIHVSNVAPVDDPETESEETVAALAFSGTEARRSPDPVMRIRSRSWIPFMSADTEAEEVEEAADSLDESKPRGRNRPKKDVSAWEDADPKEWVEGKVRSVQSYGAFVTLPDGMDGLLHVSQMSDSYTENPEEIVKPGDDVKVRVIKVDTERNQVALSMTEPKERRQSNRGGGNRAAKTEALKALAETADDKVFIPGTVVSIQDFGAFVKVQEGVEGLVHISQIKDGYLGAVGDAVAVGDEVKVRIVSVDTAKGKLGLSMREWKDPAERDDNDRGSRDTGAMFGPGSEDGLSAEELEGFKVGYDESAPSWLDVAMARDAEKKAKKAAGEKYLMSV